MRILVTGGAGYLGCCLVPQLLERGHFVRLFDRFCFGEAPVESFRAHPNCELVRGDIRRLQESPDLLDGIEAISHLASLSNDPSCDLDPDMTTDVNQESTRELANQAVQHGVRRFVLASTCAVYGHGVFDILDEQSPTNPVSTFAASKLGAEKILLEMKSDAFEPVVARAATMFGWSPRMRFDLAINHMVGTAVCGNYISILGGGNQWRPFVHVRDAARALVLMLEAPAEMVSGDVFNVGTDVFNSRIGDLAQRVAKFFEGVRINAAKEDDDLRNYRVTFAKIRERLGFSCEYSVDEGICEVRDRIRELRLDPFADAHFNIKRMRQLLATPVDEGGEPAVARFIPLAQPVLDEKEETAVISALRSGWLTSGPQVQIFEKGFAEKVSAPHAVAVSSCTAALHLCLVHVGVKPGDEVITTPLNWASTGNTIINMGANIVFADVLPGTLNIDPRSVERAITERTKAIMPVHMAGQPCDLDEVYAVARRHHIPVIEDAAHALGAGYKGVPIGSYGDYTCFSFYAIKNITTMEGGAVTVKQAEDGERLRVLAGNGMQASAWQRYGRSAMPSPPEVVVPGYKYLMSNVSAAMGVEQLRKFAAFKASRQRLANMYRTVLEDVEEIRLLDVRNDVEHAWHLFIIRLNLNLLRKTRNEVAYALRRENVGTGFHFYGLHLHRYYREALGMKPEDLPEATAASYDVLSLPLYPLMTDKNCHEVIGALKKVLAHARK
jgi:dTDP-4-amino-4,6-dideoxygalactose transaminase/nucleoside-diphosphate-sugar epimerase